jgi:hypothetical protein
MKNNRDFNQRTEEERQLMTDDTWCDSCGKPDLGLIEPNEYEEDGKIFIAGKCRACGADVVTEIIEEEK